MDITLPILHCHIDYFSENSGKVSEDQEKWFNWNVKYDGQLEKKSITNDGYCQKEFDIKQKTKNPESTFLLKKNGRFYFSSVILHNKKYISLNSNKRQYLFIYLFMKNWSWFILRNIDLHT